MGYECHILADSINPFGDRLTTFEITFPRFILAELNTHRMLSRNSASSRAIPTEKQIEKVMAEPFVPDFNRRVTGMGVGEALSERDNRRMQAKWLAARESAVKAAQQFLEVDKSRANRLLEPFMWHTAIVSATEWENFYNLRDHPAAQPEFRKIAGMMRVTQAAHDAKQLDWGEWHLPLVYDEDLEDVPYEKFPAEVSAGRCARVSYDRQHDDDHPQDAAERWRKLANCGHWSPGEHPARAVDLYEYKEASPEKFYGNFKGFVQLRKHYPGEQVFHG